MRQTGEVASPKGQFPPIEELALADHSRWLVRSGAWPVAQGAAGGWGGAGHGIYVARGGAGRWRGAEQVCGTGSSGQVGWLAWGGVCKAVERMAQGGVCGAGQLTGRWVVLQWIAWQLIVVG